MRVAVVALAMFVLALAMAACGGRKQSSVVGLQPSDNQVAPAGKPAVSLAEALAELEALECPEGVDAALWAELKAALREALEAQAPLMVSRRGSLAPLLDSGKEPGWLARPTQKFASTPPMGEANRVNDLSIADNGDGTYTLTWRYRNLGDYSQDGVVDIADITPLAMHFGETYEPQTEPNSIPAVIDGSGNGRIGIEDVTPIARSFGIEVADYLVEGATALDGAFSELDAMPVEEATGADNGRAHYAHIFTPGEYAYFRVVARDGAQARGEESNVVGIALQILSVTPTEVKEGTVVTFSAEVLGAGPLEFAWDFSGGAQYDSYTDPSPRVVLTRATGEFPASLTVTGPTGNATYPFTLLKLAREWKYETLLTDVGVQSDFPQMAQSGDEVWVYACESPFDTPPNVNYMVHGCPGRWTVDQLLFSGSMTLRAALSVDSSGRPGVAYLGGELLDEVLSFAEKSGAGWEVTELEEARGFFLLNLVYAYGDEPVITFGATDDRDVIRCWWRRDDEWVGGVVDEQGSTGQHGRTDRRRMATAPDGSPVICYNIWEQMIGCQLTVAEWENEREEWHITAVERDSWDEGAVLTGYYPAIAFDSVGRLALTYSRLKEPVEDSFFDELVYAVRQGGSWVKEVVAEGSSVGYHDKTFQDAALAHDALGEPVILVTAYPGVYPEDTPSLQLYWRAGRTWSCDLLAEGGCCSSVPSIVFDNQGGLYIVFQVIDQREVVFGSYE